MRSLIKVVPIALVAIVGSAWVGARTANTGWSADERKLLASLTLAALPPLPDDPSNRVANDSAAAQFGKKLFFDTRLSRNDSVSCGSCHLPDRDFQDGTPLARGVGVTDRRTMPIAGTAYSPFLFWDGRRDSQWSQALGPLESPVEHGGDRTQYARYVAVAYAREYARVFGPVPDVSSLPAHASPAGDRVARQAWVALPPARQREISTMYANIGKAIAAFERRVTFTPSRFDRYVAVELAGGAHTPADRFTPDEEAGLRLFIGKASCVNCHNGARLTDDHFHNTGVARSPLVSATDSGRSVGVRDVVASEFNCLSSYSDARPEQCSELRFAVTEGHELVRAFKTPSLRNVAIRAPYMHAGQIATLAEVVSHYDRAPRAPFGHSELKRLRLSADERKKIEAFLLTLTSPLSVEEGRQRHSNPPTKR
jgi:cytochrome c peroxidase